MWKSSVKDSFDPGTLKAMNPNIASIYFLHLVDSTRPTSLSGRINKKPLWREGAKSPFVLILSRYSPQITFVDINISTGKWLPSLRRFQPLNNDSSFRGGSILHIHPHAETSYSLFKRRVNLLTSTEILCFSRLILNLSTYTFILCVFILCILRLFHFGSVYISCFYLGFTLDITFEFIVLFLFFLEFI